MKQSYILYFFFALSFDSAQAQSDPITHKYFVGVKFNVRFNNITGIDSNFVQIPSPNSQVMNLGLTTRFGFDLSQRLTFGGEAGFSKFLSTGLSSSIFDINDYQFALFGRYNINPQDRFLFYTELEPSFSNLVEKSTNTVVTATSSIMSLRTNLKFGFLYNINDRFRVTGNIFQMGYSFKKELKKISTIETPLNYDVTSSFGFSTFNDVVQFGLEYRFQRPSKRKLKQ
jgi:hypothetical protein